MFRKSLVGGFREEDVLNYIRDIHQKLAVLEHKLQEKGVSSGENEARLRELTAENEKLRAQTAEQSRLIASLTEQCRDYDRLRNKEEELRRKSEKFDAFLRNADEILSKARREAAEIVARAKEKSAALEAEIQKTYAEFSAVLESLNVKMSRFRAGENHDAPAPSTGREADGAVESEIAATAPAEIRTAPFEAAPAESGPAAETPAEPVDAKPVAGASEPPAAAAPGESVHSEPMKPRPEPDESRLPVLKTAETLPQAILAAEPAENPTEPEKAEPAETDSAADPFSALEALFSEDTDLLKLIRSLKAFGMGKDSDP